MPPIPLTRLQRAEDAYDNLDYVIIQPALNKADEYKIVSSFKNREEMYMVVLGYHKNNTPPTEIIQQRVNKIMCAFYKDVALRPTRRQQDANKEVIGCSCPDFLFRSLNAKKIVFNDATRKNKTWNNYIPMQTDAVHGCKHMLYVREYTEI